MQLFFINLIKFHPDVHGTTLAVVTKTITMNSQQQNNYRENVAKKAEHDNDPNAIYTDEGSTLETKEEFEQDQKSDHSKDDNKIAATGIDDPVSNSDGAAGTDRAGTFERKIYGDPELNKGLESQAKDEES